jgi:nucleoside-diphosphate-sugar epimerase
LRKAAANGKDFPMTDGGQVRDFTPVRTVARRFLTACLEPLHGVRIENVGSGEAMSLLDFARREWTSCGAVGGLLPGALPHRKNEVMRYVPDLKPFDLPFTA